MWFVRDHREIPAALWLAEAHADGGAGGLGVMRSVAALPLSSSQRLVTVEVGQVHDERRGLVLGVNAAEHHGAATTWRRERIGAAADAGGASGFAQILSRFRRDQGLNDNPPEGAARLPPWGPRRWPGKAGSTASAGSAMRCRIAAWTVLSPFL